MHKRNVLWVASFPKSGNTWVSSILEVAGRKHNYPQGDYDVYRLVSSGKLPAVCPAVGDRFSSAPCSVLKTHAVFQATGLPHMLPSLELVNAGFIHIYRNPLDVLLSYINFTKIEYREFTDNEDYARQLFVDLLGFQEPVEYDKWRTLSLEAIPRRNLDHALDCFSRNGMVIGPLQSTAGSWIEHIESWKSAANMLPGLSMRYEDCLRDHQEFNRMAEMFAFDEAAISNAVYFVNARTVGSRLANERHRIFYNKMESGYFRDFFSRSAIDRFMSTHEAVLIRHGYSDLLEHA